MRRRFAFLMLLCAPAFGFESVQLKGIILAPAEAKTAALSGIAVDSTGHIWVTDTANDQLHEYSPKGEFLQTIGRHGQGAGEFSAPHGIAASSDGLVYVADSDNARIQIFSLDGKFQDTFGQKGGETGQFRAPWHLTVSRDGVVLIADKDSSRVQFFSKD